METLTEVASIVKRLAGEDWGLRALADNGAHAGLLRLLHSSGKCGLLRLLHSKGKCGHTVAAARIATLGAGTVYWDVVCTYRSSGFGLSINLKKGPWMHGIFTRLWFPDLSSNWLSF